MKYLSLFLPSFSIFRIVQLPESVWLKLNNEKKLCYAVLHRESWAQASPWRCSRSKDKNTSTDRSLQLPVSFRYLTKKILPTVAQYSRGIMLSQSYSLIMETILSCNLFFLFLYGRHVGMKFVLSNQRIAIFMPLQTSWRCFAVENFDSATFKMFLRKRSNIPASSLSTPKPKKSVSNHFIDFSVTASYTQFPVY